VDEQKRVKKEIKETVIKIRGFGTRRERK